jgi:uncharacterized SAM-binding protein YcdF (DUF218 family)
VRTHVACRGLGLAGVILFFVSAFTPLPNVVGHRIASPPRLAPADAIVVLGASLQGDMLGCTSLRETLHGIRLYRRGLAPLLVLSGSSQTEGPSEAEIRAELAREQGVRPEAILLVSDARTTREEAMRVQARIGASGARRILLVTDSQHMRRAQGVFERAGFDVLAAPVDDIPLDASGPEGRLLLTRWILEEWAARVYYRVAGYL